MPDVATRSCRLNTLPASPSISDLEISYAARGADLVACEAARKLAVETFEAQRSLVDTLSSQTRGSWISRWID